MIDQKKIFDDMVKQFSRTQEIADKILQHKLYIAASTRLAGSLEYMALAKLQEMVENHKYDLIVLDTPPDSNALDFLHRPNILSGFMENGVMNWLIKPFHVASRLRMDKLFSVGEKLMGGLAKVTGFQALSTLAEFLVLIQNVIDGFHACGQRVGETLKSSQTSFLLVTALNQASARSAKNLCLQMKRLRFPLNGIIFNKVVPQEVAASAHGLNDLADAAGECTKLMKNLWMRCQVEASLQSEILTMAHELFPHNHPLQIRIDEQNFSDQPKQDMMNLSLCFDTPDLKTLF